MACILSLIHICDQAVLADVGEQGKRAFLHHALPRHHEQIGLLLKFRNWEYSGNLLIPFQLQEVHNRRSLGSPPGFGELIALLHIDLALGGEEQQIVMRGRDKHILHKILLLGGQAGDALAAPLLGPVVIAAGALDIAVVRQRDHHFFLLDELIHIDLILVKGDGGSAGIAIFPFDLQKILPDDIVHQLGIAEHLSLIHI